MEAQFPVPPQLPLVKVDIQERTPRALSNTATINRGDYVYGDMLVYAYFNLHTFVSVSP